ncbi:DUF4422 domain-containing protein [Selenomonas sp. KH1T6]|uniref:DUF4422 domain-containing protein n=1 Tax=Selenomonas sp. KH1T6 TaxID=3158784 RepID=UPI0008A7D9C8|nr:protein of unknown function [Selenomonas ruminantium]
MGQLILYGRGLIAEEYCRYLEGQGQGADIAAFAVTKLDGQGEEYCGRPCLEIREALKTYPEADVHLALQEKYHQEVLALLKELGRKPKEIIGLHRMTELLGEQGLKEISTACQELTVGRNPYEYSMLEIFPHQHPEQKFTFYPMTQVPLSEEDVRNLRKTVMQGGTESLPLEGKGSAARLTDEVYLAMATSQKDAKVSLENLPDYIHPVMGGAAAYDGSRTAEMEYDDEEADNLSPYNSLYSELTVAHWLWKKAPQANYLGLCHYRRHFVLTEEIRQALVEGTVDVLLTIPRLTVPNVHKYFATLPVTTMDEQDFQLMLRLIEQEDSELAKFSKDFLEGQIHYPNNMVIAKRDIYLDYGNFMFKVLQGMQEHYKETGTTRPDRYLGYVGELLTTVYFAYHRGRWRTGFIDYRLLKEV